MVRYVLDQVHKVYLVLSELEEILLLCTHNRHLYKYLAKSIK